MKHQTPSNQLSLFDLLTPEPPKAEEPKEFIIWYANMSGKGEHVYARWICSYGRENFVPRQTIIDGDAEAVTFSAQEALIESQRHHARIGKMVETKHGYEIEEIWKQDLPTTL